MAMKANLTASEMEELRSNETVDFLASRLSRGGTIMKRTQLTLHLRRWMSAVERYGEVPSRAPAFLFRILIHFTTAEKAAEIRRIQTPETFTESERLLVMLRALIDEKADERVLRHLEMLPEKKITCQELLSPDLESLYHPPANPTASEQSGREIRDIMRSGDQKRMKENREVFYITGNIAWTVRAPYWHVALATDSQGDRFLSDDVLDRALPKWRLILTGEVTPTPRYPRTVESFPAWLDAEERKARLLGKPWPQIQPPTTVARPPSTPKTADSDKRSSPVLSRLRSGGRGCTSSFEIEDPQEVEQTRLLREILTETRETKKLVQDSLQRNTVHPMTQYPQLTDVAMSSEHMTRPAFQSNQGAQPYYLLPYPTEVPQPAPTADADCPVAPELMEQNQVDPLQHITPTPAPAEEAWAACQRWLGQNSQKGN